MTTFCIAFYESYLSRIPTIASNPAVADVHAVIPHDLALVHAVTGNHRENIHIEANSRFCRLCRQHGRIFAMSRRIILKSVGEIVLHMTHTCVKTHLGILWGLDMKDAGRDCCGYVSM
jgi:hypothetical protein